MTHQNIRYYAIMEQRMENERAYVRIEGRKHAPHGSRRLDEVVEVFMWEYYLPQRDQALASVRGFKADINPEQNGAYIIEPNHVFLHPGYIRHTPFEDIYQRALHAQSHGAPGVGAEITSSYHLAKQRYFPEKAPGIKKHL